MSPECARLSGFKLRVQAETKHLPNISPSFYRGGSRGLEKGRDLSRSQLALPSISISVKDIGLPRLESFVGVGCGDRMPEIKASVYSHRCSLRTRIHQKEPLNSSRLWLIVRPPFLPISSCSLSDLIHSHYFKCHLYANLYL